MEIILNNVIVHELKKDQYQSSANLDLAEATLDSTHEVTRSLVKKLIERFSTSGNRVTYGVFKTDDAVAMFPNAVKANLSVKKLSDDKFRKLSLVAMNMLKEYASKSAASTGGFILFAEYTTERGRNLLIAMIKQRLGFAIRNLRPAQLKELDLDKLAHAARINYEKLNFYEQSDDQERQNITYLNFISRKSDSSAAYFTGALGCRAGATALVSTKTVITETLGFFEKNEDIKPNKQQFREGLYTYLSERLESNQPARLSDIENLMKRYLPVGSDELIKECEGLVQGLNEEGHGVPSEFSVSKSSLNKYKRLVAETSAWKFEFDRKLLGETPSAKIYYDRKKKTLTVVVPNDVRGEIESELAERKLK